MPQSLEAPGLWAQSHVLKRMGRSPDVILQLDCEHRLLSSTATHLTAVVGG